MEILRLSNQQHMQVQEKRMATSTLTDCSQELIRKDMQYYHFKQPLRPATTSPSFYPCQTLNSHQNRVPNTKTRNQLEAFLPGRHYFSLPSTPPRPDALTGNCLKFKEERTWEIQSKSIMDSKEKTIHRDRNGNRYLPEWYIEPCVDVLNMPSLKDGNVPKSETIPLDHSQKRETYLLDSSYDEDCDFSDESQYLDFEDCSNVNPSSGEVSKLNSLGQGQSRFLSLFKYKEDGSSCCSSSSISERLDEDGLETSIASASEELLSDDNPHDSEIANGIEAVCKGLARLLSIPAENSSSNQHLSSNYNNGDDLLQQECSENESPVETNSGSRLLKLFPPAVPQYGEENAWQQDSPLCISTLWNSDSSLTNDPNNVSSETSSVKNSPTTISPEKEISPAVNVKVPNIASISPTAPLHFTTMPSCHLVDGFPIQGDQSLSSTVNSSFYTACDLSNEETEIEAALERGEGFYTNDDFPCQEIPQVDDAIWSPTHAHVCCEPNEDALKLENISPMTLKRIAENAANDIMDWLDIWLSRCTNSNGHEPEDLNNEEPTSRVADETVGRNVDPSIQSSALNIYRMFDNRTDDSAFQRILNLAEEEIISDEICPEDSIFAQLAHSPGILDFLVENDAQEEHETVEVQTQHSGSSLHFLLNSRASNIYDSYLLFPDLVHFTNPMKSFGSTEYKEFDESNLFSHLLSSSFDWMSNIDVFDNTHQNIWDQTLQSLSPKTPFTPTGNLSENLHSFERKHSITLEQLCNLATAATSVESRGFDHSSFLSTDLFVQYMQSQLGCFENIAMFNSPTLKNQLIQESSNNMYLNDEYVRLYRPIPLFPLQFINRLSLTNGDASKDNDQESLLFSPETHFRPITPRPDEKQEGDDEDCLGSQSEKSRRSINESLPDDVDDELVAIHEGADHSKLVELYAQMQLKQQLAAEQKQNHPQLVAVADNECDSEENAYEEKHIHYSCDETDVNSYALDCAAEAAATAAVTALGSADPAEALAILEEWHWKETSQEEDIVSKTFPDLGYFETAQNFLPSCDYVVQSNPDFITKSASVLENPSENQSLNTWSIDDGSSIEQNFEYDSLKKIWIRTAITIDENSSTSDCPFEAQAASKTDSRCDIASSASMLLYNNSEGVSLWNHQAMKRRDSDDQILITDEITAFNQGQDLEEEGNCNPQNSDHLFIHGSLNAYNNDQRIETDSPG